MPPGPQPINTAPAPAPKPNPLVAVLQSDFQKLKAGVGQALESQDVQGAVDGIEAMLVNSFASLAGGAIPGAQIIVGPASEFLVKEAQTFTNKALTALGQKLDPSQDTAAAAAPASPAAPAAAAPASAPAASTPRESVISSIVDLLRKL